MRKVIYIISFFLFFTCEKDNFGDCFQKVGDIIQQEISVDFFDKIFINRDIELIIKEGSDQKVVIETGENLLDDVEVKVIEGKLTLTDNNACNYVRAYGVTKVYITSPNITEIRSSTQYDVSSDGILTYPSLTILSEDFGVSNTITSANFNLQVDNALLRVVFNNLSNCFISGKTNNLNITFASGTSRFEGGELVAQDINLWNRSSNDIIVNPQQSITGRISGPGDVICVTKPPTINVEEQYKGKLIFK